LFFKPYSPQGKNIQQLLYYIETHRIMQASNASFPVAKNANDSDKRNPKSKPSEAGSLWKGGATE
jgi:hypothetical protein